MNFEQELASLLNRYSKENDSDTPDFVLAAYLAGCLDVWNKAHRSLDEFYGRTKAPVNLESEKG